MAGRQTSGDRYSVTYSLQPNRLMPAAARMIPSYSPASSFRSRVSRLPGQINLAAQQGLFDFLDEQSLASDGGQRRVEDLVPCRLDPLERHREGRLQFTQARIHPLGLPES